MDLSKSLIDAVVSQKTDEVACLLAQGADANARDSEHGETALMYAVYRADGKIVEMLLQHGADVNAADFDYQWPPCMVAQSKYLPLLVNAGADLNQQDAEGRTALMSAVEYGDAEKFSLLLEYGADETIVDENGMTAKDIAEDDSIPYPLVFREGKNQPTFLSLLAETKEIALRMVKLRNSERDIEFLHTVEESIEKELERN